MSENTPVLDWIGNTVNVGDTVFFVTRGRYPAAKCLKVESFTKTGLPKGYLALSSRWKPDREVIVRSEFVKVVKE